MKLILNGHCLIVKREKNEPRAASETAFWRRLEREINRLTGETGSTRAARNHKNRVVKKEMVKDRPFSHLVSAGEYYLRTIGMASSQSRPRDCFIRAYDADIVQTHLGFNAGEKSLEIYWAIDFELKGEKP